KRRAIPARPGPVAPTQSPATYCAIAPRQCGPLWRPTCGVHTTASRTGPVINADCDAREVPGATGVDRAVLPIVPHPEARQPSRRHTEAVPRRIVGGQCPIT